MYRDLIFILQGFQNLVGLYRFIEGVKTIPTRSKRDLAGQQNRIVRLTIIEIHQLENKRTLGF